MNKELTSTFLRVLDPGDNSTGGGSASAIAGSMAAALAAMVARLSTGGDFGQPEAVYTEIAERGHALSRELLAGSDEDAWAFDAVMAAYRLPRGSEVEKATSREAVQAAMLHATLVPLRNAELCAEVLALLGRLESRSNPRALSDLRSGGYLAAAGLRGCLANVDINLPSIKDEAAAAPIRARAETLRAIIPAAADESPDK